MGALATYQQDSTGIKSLKNTLPENTGLQDLMTTKKPVSLLNMPERKTEPTKPAPKQYTDAQIRNWQIQQERKLLVDSSRFITPRSVTELSYSVPEMPGFVLPMKQIHQTSTDWLTVLIFLCLAIFATMRYAYQKYMGHLFLSVFNYTTSVRMLQEKKYPVIHGAFRLDIIFYITFSLFIFQLLNLIKWENAITSPSYFFIILGLVFLYYLIKKLLYLFIGLLFESVAETREFLFNMDNVNRILGLILLPVVILISFSPLASPVFIVFSGLTIAIIFNLLLLQRGVFILLKKQFSIFYLFLYLCTLEFLPLLLIYKVVVE